MPGRLTPDIAPTFVTWNCAVRSPSKKLTYTLQLLFLLFLVSATDLSTCFIKITRASFEPLANLGFFPLLSLSNASRSLHLPAFIFVHSIFFAADRCFLLWPDSRSEISGHENSQDTGRTFLRMRHIGDSMCLVTVHGMVSFPLSPTAACSIASRESSVLAKWRQIRFANLRLSIDTFRETMRGLLRVFLPDSVWLPESRFPLLWSRPSFAICKFATYVHVGHLIQRGFFYDNLHGNKQQVGRLWSWIVCFWGHSIDGKLTLNFGNFVAFKFF